jgi:hypothetical protein
MHVKPVCNSQIGFSGGCGGGDVKIFFGFCIQMVLAIANQESVPAIAGGVGL